MTSAKNATATQKMSVAELEKRIPSNAELKRVRIERGLVAFGLGYDKKGDVAILWRSSGKAYIRPMTKKGLEEARTSRTYDVMFNGWHYTRAKQYDLEHGDEEK